MLENQIVEFKAWAAKPYRENGSLLDWFLFIGLLTVATILWTRVVKEILD